MNSQHQLETELRELRPRGVSPELKRRVVKQLESRPTLEAHRSWGVALAAGLAAACLAAVSLWWIDNPREQTRDNVSHQLAVSPAENAELGPTVLAYRRALVRSSQHLNDLLDRHSMVTLPHNAARNGIRAFIRSDASHPSFTGEL